LPENRLADFVDPENPDGGRHDTHDRACSNCDARARRHRLRRTRLVAAGPSTTAQQKVFRGFYDGHHDVYLVTDVSNKAQAKALGINYSAELAAAKNAPAQYFIEGHAPAGQLSVFGSEPGEADYNPLWEDREVVGMLVGRTGQW
jgi:hypothetical protein